MNVLYVTANSHLRSTTASLNAIIRVLGPRGVRPTLLFDEPGPWQEALQREGIVCHIRRLFVPSKNAPARSLLHTYSLVRLLKSERIDLVHCNEHQLYPALRIATRWARVPMLTTLHFTLTPGFGHWAFSSSYRPAALQFLSRGQLELSRAGIPPDFPVDRVKLLMSGLFVDEFLSRGDDGQSLRRSWGADESTVVLGTASAIKRHKRLEDFIQIVHRMRQSGRKVMGVIAGGGRFEDAAYRAELNELIGHLGLGAYCRFTGNLDPITPFCKAIDIAINTSEMEQLSMSMCEAMACGAPTLAYAVGGNPETVPDSWCVVPFGAIDELAARAGALVDDASLRRSMGASAERHVRLHFDAPALAQRQAAIYEEVLGRPIESNDHKRPN